jgi:hypothetical protein
MAQHNLHHQEQRHHQQLHSSTEPQGQHGWHLLRQQQFLQQHLSTRLIWQQMSGQGGLFLL